MCKFLKVFLAMVVFAFGAAASQKGSGGLFDADSAIESYSKLAAEKSLRTLRDDDINELFKEVKNIISKMLEKYTGKQNPDIEFVFKNSITEEDPNFSAYPYKSKETSPRRSIDLMINKLAFATYRAYKYLQDDKKIKNILKKSPLEFVTLLQDLRCMFEFVGSDPQKYGHGVFRTDKGNKITISATPQAFIRIYLQVFMERCLSTTINGVYSPSRLVCLYYKNIKEIPNPYDSIAKFKRYPNHSRAHLAVKIDEADIKTNAAKQDNAEIEFLNSTQNQSKRHESIELAKRLLGINPDADFSRYAEQIQTQIKKFADSLTNKKAKTKADQSKINRDVKDLNYCSNLIGVISSLYDSINKQPDAVIGAIIDTNKYEIINMARVFVVFFRCVAKYIESHDGIEGFILNEFSKQLQESLDETYLLPTTISSMLKNKINPESAKLKASDMSFLALTPVLSRSF